MTLFFSSTSSSQQCSWSTIVGISLEYTVFSDLAYMCAIDCGAVGDLQDFCVSAKARRRGRSLRNAKGGWWATRFVLRTVTNGSRRSIMPRPVVKCISQHCDQMDGSVRIGRYASSISNSSLWQFFSRIIFHAKRTTSSMDLSRLLRALFIIPSNIRK